MGVWLAELLYYITSVVPGVVLIMEYSFQYQIKRYCILSKAARVGHGLLTSQNGTYKGSLYTSGIAVYLN